MVVGDEYVLAQPVGRGVEDVSMEVRVLGKHARESGNDVIPVLARSSLVSDDKPTNVLAFRLVSCGLLPRLSVVRDVRPANALALRLVSCELLLRPSVVRDVRPEKLPAGSDVIPVLDR